MSPCAPPEANNKAPIDFIRWIRLTSPLVGLCKHKDTAPSIILMKCSLLKSMQKKKKRTEITLNLHTFLQLWTNLLLCCTYEILLLK